MSPEERFERIETNLDFVAKTQREMAARQGQSDESQARSEGYREETDRRLAEMAARQQYHDEAFERMDARLNTIMTAIEIDAENIRRLGNIAAAHEQRLSDLEGSEET